MMLLWTLVVLVVLVAFRFPRTGSSCFKALAQALTTLAERRGWALLLVGLLSGLACAGLSLCTRLPEPGIHDEFSYLLAADTFAHGRLTNPPHPLGVHFESMHILQQPTYASKYPPGQGLALAAGQILGGHPIAGVWASTALACAAIYWMLLAWLPSRWALLGGLLTALNPLVLSWSQCYWGGAVAMAGGALVLGGFRRIVAEPRIQDAIWLGLGVALLANSRPFEGLILSLMVAVALLLWMLRPPRPPLRLVLVKFVLPTSLVLTLTGLLMGFYNYRITGNPLQMPYSVHEAAYSITPIFLWQQPAPAPVYHHPVIRDFQTVWAFSFYQRQQSLRGFVADCGRKILTLGKWYLWSFVMLVPLLFALPGADPWLRLTLRFSLLFTASLFPVTWTLQPHYAAPVAGLFVLLSMESLRHLGAWQWRGQPIGYSLAGGLLVVCLVASFMFCRRHSHFSEGNFARAHLLAELRSQEGQHLVVVRYSPKHSPHDEWVYNEADIDGAKVLWAREMEATQNRKLLDYFKTRKIWLLEPDVKPLRIAPYP